ncbi:MAG: bestrophin family protein [Gemmataceae bacterium]
MIEYDRNQFYRIAFAFRGTVLPHVLGRAGALTLLCLALYAVNELALKPAGGKLEALDPLGHNVLGVALSMLIVFRTNSSNSRYWEARSHWGMLVNTTRSLARMAAAYSGEADGLTRLIAAYVVQVREQLRGNKDVSLLRNLLTGRQLDRLQGVNNPASVLAGLMSEWVAERLRERRLDPIMAMKMEELIVILLDQQGGCEKILKTPLPFVYAALIKQALLFYLATLPLVLVPKMGVMAPLVVAGVALVMLGIEEAGVEIEGPFGLDPNHLPLESLCEMMGTDAADLARTIGHDS